MPAEQQSAMVDQAVRFALTENLDLALAAIETVAAEKAVQQVDESLHTAFAVCVLYKTLFIILVNHTVCTTFQMYILHLITFYMDVWVDTATP